MVRIGQREPLFYFFEDIKVGRASPRAPTKTGSRAHYLQVQQERTEETASVPSEEFTFVLTQTKDSCQSGIIPVTSHHGHD